MFFLTTLMAIITFDFQKRNVRAFLLCLVFVFILIGGLRGNFTTDYSHYVAYFEYIKHISFMDIFTRPGEKGFALLTFVISRLFESPIPFFVVCMTIIMIPIYNHSSKCENPFLFMLLYLSFGVMFQSYNVMRFVMMSSLFLYSFKWMKEGNFIKYFVFVLFLTSIHTTALFLIPFYFLLRLDVNVKSILIHFFVIFALCFLLDPVMDYFDVLFYHGKYETRDANQVGVARIASIVVPIVFTLSTFLLAFFKKLDVKLNKIEYNIFFNSTIYWISAFFIAQKIAILGRFSYVFFPFVASWFVNNVTYYEQKQRSVLVWLTFCFCTVYFFVFGQYYKVFYFFWQPSYFE